MRTFLNVKRPFAQSALSFLNIRHRTTVFILNFSFNVTIVSIWIFVTLRGGAVHIVSLLYHMEGSCNVHYLHRQCRHLSCVDCVQEQQHCYYNYVVSFSLYIRSLVLIDILPPTCCCSFNERTKGTPSNCRFLTDWKSLSRFVNCWQSDIASPMITWPMMSHVANGDSLRLGVCWESTTAVKF